MRESFSGKIIHYYRTPKRVVYSLFTKNHGVIQLLSKDAKFALLDSVDVALSRRGSTFFLQDYTIVSPSPLMDVPQNLLPVSYVCSLAKEFVASGESEYLFLESMTQTAHTVMKNSEVAALERLWLKTTGFGRGDESNPSDIILDCLPHLQRLRRSFTA